jgi:hypothetical protein
VVYALRIPSTVVILVGPMPEPTHAPPAVGFDDVTKGYVPWSTSSRVPCEPSSSTVSPFSSAALSRYLLSAIRCLNPSACVKRFSTISA